MSATRNRTTVLVIHGPNLNMLGTREPSVYGRVTLAELDAMIRDRGKALGLEVETFQSNHEGAMVEKIQEAAGSCAGLVINPAAYTHTSVAIRDAILLLDMPVIEVHLTNVFKREAFRHRSLVTDVATGQICGLGAQGYLLAIEAVADLISK